MVIIFIKINKYFDNYFIKIFSIFPSIYYFNITNTSKSLINHYFY